MKKLFAVLGDPIGHSMSPAMHNDLFSYYNIDAHYLPLLVKHDDLHDAVKGLKAIGAAGFNVTVPHKSTIISFLDEVDPLALSIGAVNTVVREGNKLKGYNTDGQGFLKGLQFYLPSLTGQKVLIIGAGGAAKAIYFTIASNQPLRVDLANRTFAKALKLVQECPFPVLSKAVSLEEAEETLSEYDLVIQTTMIGMAPRTSDQPLRLTNLRKQTIVSDIIYNPLETQLLSEAKKMGAVVQNGLDMFILQGALAFEKWTGIFPDVDRMRKNVLQQLGGKLC